MDALAKHERRMGMAQVMQSDAAQARTPHDLDNNAGCEVTQLALVHLVARDATGWYNRDASGES